MLQMMLTEKLKFSMNGNESIYKNAANYNTSLETFVKFKYHQSQYTFDVLPQKKSY